MYLLMSTAWEKVEFEGDLAPWELREMEEGNLAAFATRSFKKGEKICSERPTVWVSGHHPFNEEQVAEIEEKVMSLNDIDRASFYDMANVFPDAPTPAAGIFMTNCFDMADAAHGQSCAMYCAIGRLNHSCEPNAQQTHIPDTFVEVLYASRDIAVGDEINDCYIDLRQSTHERRVALQDIYRFHCTCKACLRADEDKVKNENEETEGEVNSVSVSVFASASIGTGVCEQDRERVKAHLNDDRVVSTVDKGDVERALGKWVHSSLCYVYAMFISDVLHIALYC